MNRWLFLLICLSLLGACQQMPPREEMLSSVCERQPCRPATVIQLQDQSGEPHPVQVPAGPIFAGGWLSVISGEQHALVLMEDKAGRIHPSWAPAVAPSEARFRIKLQQVNEEGLFFSELRLQNPLDRPLFLQAEQLVAGEDRFHPLPLPPIPPGESVRKRWNHTILEVQVLGFQGLGKPLQ
ncbi:hypothetical protein J2T60_000464 [Natronospira proteinivora]|uniref:Lipoprotein n=1 Tax=Natronospira proteinivora TaxID=1807133 RepID=A0ABT1G5B6_9GAMM|nr:hypothetical protein [Natronospira proteinivora]MCP1726499.1 hypothetical protein [Natronospira proteinivora]